MSRIILHVGTHKTATTAIQRGLARNRGGLARMGVIVPRFGPNPGHHLLAGEWVCLPQLPRSTQTDTARARAWDRLARRAASGATVLLSSEMFSAVHSGAVDWHALRARLAAFDRVEVVVVLRNPQELVQSLWLQVARTRRPPEPARLVARAMREGRAGPVPLDYPALLSRLHEGLAGARFHVLPFSRLASDPGGPLACLLGTLGIPSPAGGLVALAEARPNAAPPPLAGWLAAQAGGLSAEGVAMAHAMLEARFGIGLRQSLFTRAEARALAAHFNPLNAGLAALAGPGVAADRCPGTAGADLFRCDLAPLGLRRRVAA